MAGNKIYILFNYYDDSYSYVIVMLILQLKNKCYNFIVLTRKNSLQASAR